MDEVKTNFFKIEKQEFDTNEKYAERRKNFREQNSKSPRVLCNERSLSKNASQFHIGQPNGA